eukprot:NODE_4619_length_642_cov_254.684654_g3961_i0.p1 GENE.NODE_4619_length_642_cov_254.684654_g3961_i0~~NODE_4619_length_642_cov_254.684654_g3961_i0.p1  ORF type:complete len:159 (-),score=30.40 NODE_4619_length_642_cov_254.684654_g3961_i0:164-640(-)
MADEETGEYHTAESGSSTTYPIQCGLLKKNHYCCIKGRPVKIVDYSTSKTGKHGHAKAHIVGIDIFTGKKLEELCPTTHNMDAPNVSRQEYTLMDIAHDGYLSLLDADGNEKSDIKLPDDEQLQNTIKKHFDDGKELTLSIIAAMGEEAVVACKESSS